VFWVRLRGPAPVFSSLLCRLVPARGRLNYHLRAAFKHFQDSSTAVEVPDESEIWRSKNKPTRLEPKKHSCHVEDCREVMECSVQKGVQI
jgi:hypothetical protein